VPKTSAADEPIPAHAFIASEGGLSKLAQSALGVDGNPRIGNLNLFGKAGMTIEQATEKLKAEGYLPQGAGNNEALALIKRSLTNPQYTPEGVERMAAKEQAAAFEDYLAAEEEAALSDDFDPFVSVAELEYEIEQAENAGCDEASDAIKKGVNAELGLAESQGIDVDEIKYNAADETYNQSEQAYYEAAKRILEKALAGSNGDSNQDVSGEVETLVAPSREEVIEKQDREAEAVRSEKEQQKAKDLAAKKEQERKEIAKASEAAADSFELGGDAMENLTGQKPMFSRRATETLDAAGVTGKERVDAMIAINRGDITPEQLEAAYPAKNPQTETENADLRFSEAPKPKTKTQSLAPTTAKPNRDPADTPVQVYRETFKRTPNEAQRAEIQKRVTDLNHYRTTLANWQLSGWNPGNVLGQLDRYEQTKPKIEDQTLTVQQPECVALAPTGTGGMTYGQPIQRNQPKSFDQIRVEEHGRRLNGTAAILEQMRSGELRVGFKQR